MASTDFLTDGLNREQQLAVTASPDSHYLVLAGAGCGKTTVLTRRIVWLAAHGFPMGKILALTFTRKAAEEMAARVAHANGSSRPDALPAVATFHSFALQVLSTKHDSSLLFNHIGFQGRPTCCNETERLKLLAQCCSAEERNELGVDLLHIEGKLDRFNLFGEQCTSTLPDETGLVSEIAGRFRRRKQAEGVWDFSDLISGVVVLFEKFPEILRQFQLKYSVILVDEFQDTNPLQIRLLHQLLRGGQCLFAVGDDDQAIYGFRGADVRPMLEFATCFPGAQIIKLQTNYRSVPSILSKANKIFRHKESAYRKVLVSGKYSSRFGHVPVIHRFLNQTAMAEWILSEAAACSAALHLPQSSMACLFRINQTAQWMVDCFSGMEPEEKRRPQLLTVHKSKGLEFPVVFLCDLEESVFPSYREPKKHRITSPVGIIRYILSVRKNRIPCDWDEETRLFYVAVTRAQQRLYLCTVRNKVVWGRNRRCKPSRFLRLIG